MAKPLSQYTLKEIKFAMHNAVRQSGQLCGKKKGKCQSFATVKDSAALGINAMALSERYSVFQKTKGARDQRLRKQRRQIGKVKGNPALIGYATEAHHLLCTSIVMDKEFKKYAKAAAYDMNNGWNCISLPMDYGFQKWDKLQRHKGGHWNDYYDEIKKFLRDIVNKSQNFDPCNEAQMKNLHTMFHVAEQDLFDKLKKKSLWLYDDSEDAFENDYKSELGNSKGGGVSSSKGSAGHGHTMWEEDPFRWASYKREYSAKLYPVPLKKDGYPRKKKVVSSTIKVVQNGKVVEYEIYK